MDEVVQSQFTCVCGKQEGWVTEGTKTKPCPSCGRVYIGEYDRNNFTLIAKEVKGE